MSAAKSGTSFRSEHDVPHFALLNAGYDFPSRKCRRNSALILRSAPKARVSKDEGGPVADLMVRDARLRCARRAPHHEAEGGITVTGITV